MTVAELRHSLAKSRNRPGNALSGTRQPVVHHLTICSAIWHPCCSDSPNWAFRCAMEQSRRP